MANSRRVGLAAVVGGALALAAGVPARAADPVFVPAPQSPAMVDGANPAQLRVGHLNSDGILDFAATKSGSAEVAIMFGDGDGSFTMGQDISMVTATAPGPRNPDGLDIVDVNHDGLNDVAVADWDQKDVTVLLQDAPGHFTPTAPIPLPGAPCWIESADFDGDGRPDLATANLYDNNVTILSNDGQGGLPVTAVIPSIGSLPCAMTHGDLDGDAAIDDLAVGGNNPAPSVVTVLLSNGAAGFTATSPFLPDDGQRTIATADFNGDTRADLAVTNVALDTVTVLFGIGGGAFATTGAPLPTGDVPASIIAPDLNGDGARDLVIGNYAGHSLTLYKGDGIGGFQAPAVHTIVMGPAPVRSIGAGDFDGDGTVDLAALYRGNPQAAGILINETPYTPRPRRPPGHFQCHSLFTTHFTPRDVQLADQFGDDTVEVKTPGTLCTPVRMDTSPIRNRREHLRCYRTAIRPPLGQTVHLHNQFGTFSAIVQRPQSLCVPSTKQLLDGPTPAIKPFVTDHFRCYGISPLGSFILRSLTLRDQFGKRSANVTKPRRLCVPTRKNDTPARYPKILLTCYRTTPADVRVKDVILRNQFGDDQGKTGLAFEVCLPSRRVPQP